MAAHSRGLARRVTWSSASWLWAAGPTHDVEAALCAGTVFIVGLALVTVRGTRDRVREPS